MAFNELKNATAFMNQHFNFNQMESNTTSPADQFICNLVSKQSFGAISFFIILGILIFCKLLHVPFRLAHQPRLITEITVGLFVGNIAMKHDIVEKAVPSLMMSISEFGMSCYMLVLGLEMDLTVFIRWPTREVLLSYASFFSTIVIATVLVPYIKLSTDTTVGFNASLAVTLSGTASSVLTRLVTDLKISQSEIGKLVVQAGMHTDMVSMLYASISSIFFKENNKKVNKSAASIVGPVIVFLIEALVVIKLVPAFVNWINTSNPEGKPMKGPHLVLFLAFMFLLCNFGPRMVGYSPVMTAFLIGLAFPRKGRLSKMLNNKTNQFLGYIVFPLYFCWIGMSAKFGNLTIEDKFIGVKLFFLFIIMTIGKVTGSLLASLVLGFHWREAIAMGLLLNIKGHYYLFTFAFAIHQGFLGTGSYIVMLFSMVFGIVYLPSVIKILLKRAKTEAAHQQMGLQWLEPNTELRMLLCVHGPQNVQTMIKLIEISRGNKNPGLGVYVTDMVETHDGVSTLSDDNSDNETIADESVIDMREEITDLVLKYLEDSGEGINVHRLLTVSTFAYMHNDLCNLAEAIQASIIILPYHKYHKRDGNGDGNRKGKNASDDIHYGFRHVNCKVLRHAPCSVGILVDRGLGLLLNNGTSSYVILNVAVVFIGGKDDREALFYAVRLSKHPGISLTAIRFLQDSNAEKASSKASHSRMLQAMQEQEMKLDDECFTEFYEKNVAHGRVGYLEKHVSTAKETVATLKGLEAQYVLLIVGRGSRVNSISAAIMTDWEECPDLGPIGEILADKDFSATASVLVIQQHYTEETDDDRIM